MRLIEKNDKLINKISDYIKHDISEEMYGQLNRCAESLARKNWNPQKISDNIISSIIQSAHRISLKILLLLPNPIIMSVTEK